MTVFYVVLPLTLIVVGQNFQFAIIWRWLKLRYLRGRGKLCVETKTRNFRKKVDDLKMKYYWFRTFERVKIQDFPQSWRIIMLFIRLQDHHRTLSWDFKIIKNWKYRYSPIYVIGQGTKLITNYQIAFRVGDYERRRQCDSYDRSMEGTILCAVRYLKVTNEVTNSINGVK